MRRSSRIGNSAPAMSASEPNGISSRVVLGGNSSSTCASRIIGKGTARRLAIVTRRARDVGGLTDHLILTDCIYIRILFNALVTVCRTYAASFAGIRPAILLQVPTNGRADGFIHRDPSTFWMTSFRTCHALPDLESLAQLCPWLGSCADNCYAMPSIAYAA